MSYLPNWGLPNVTGSEHFKELEKVARYGTGTLYDESYSALRSITEKGAAERSKGMFGLESKFGPNITLGAMGGIESQYRAGIAGELADTSMKIQMGQEEAKYRARGSLLNILMQHQGTVANLVSAHESLTQQKELAQKQLEAQEAVSWIVGAEYGLTSQEEQLMQIWKRMQLRIAHGKRWKLKFWRAVFTGYHRAAPWVVSRTMRSSALLKMRKCVVDDFVRYVLCDIWEHRKKRVREILAAVCMLGVSLTGWRFGRGRSV